MCEVTIREQNSKEPRRDTLKRPRQGDIFSYRDRGGTPLILNSTASSGEFVSNTSIFYTIMIIILAHENTEHYYVNKIFAET